MDMENNAFTLNLGDNVNGFLHTDGKLYLCIDITKRGGISKTGKTLRVASTEGNLPIKGTEVKLGLNVFAPIPA